MDLLASAHVRAIDFFKSDFLLILGIDPLWTKKLYTRQGTTKRLTHAPHCEINVTLNQSN